MKFSLSFPVLILSIITLLVLPKPALADPGSPNSIDLFSVSSSGVHGNFASEDPAVSDDGRYGAFRSAASNLVVGDTNGAIDIFVRSLETGKTARVSVDSGGNQANGSSYFPSISATGRFVAFLSQASNLVPGDTNNAQDVFVHDRDADGDGIFDEPGAVRTVRVSVRTDGAQGSGSQCGIPEIPSISGDGRYVAFHSCFTNLVTGDTNNLPDVFVHDRDVSGNGVFDEPGDTSTTRVSVDSQGGESNGASIFAIISGDGNFVTFRSSASNLVSGDTNGLDDVFLHNMKSGATTLVSVASDGTQAYGMSQEGDISGDGRYILFSSNASNLVAGDANNAWDAFLHDTQSGETIRVSQTPQGVEGNGDSFADSMSSNGSLIVFDSTADNLVSGDTNGFKDIYVYSRLSGAIREASVTGPGVEGNGDSLDGDISGSGLAILFTSYADNLVSQDTNNNPDVFRSQIKLFLPLISK